MPDIQLAVISDIHGNRWALEAVLEDIERRGVRETVNLGDSLYGPLDPAGTAQILLQLNQPTVRGNEDRIIVERARYSIVSKDKSGRRVENIAVTYDWQSAATAARANERPDWADWLQTGRVDLG